MLGFPGDPFTLFYDHDQVELHKLTSLNREQKAEWFRRRLYMALYGAAPSSVDRKSRI